MTNENDKKMEYLKRGEIKTMEKDISRLREIEAQKERERIAQLRAAEELRKEREREEKARQEAEARKKAEEEAKKRIQELKRLRAKRAGLAEAVVAEEEKKKEEQKEEFREKLKEVQQREEEERKKFLERVAAKAEEKKPEVVPPLRPTPPPTPPPEPPPSAPPKISPKKPGIKFPKIPKPPAPKISGVFPEKPSVMNKIWVRVIISLLIFTILAAVATFWYWYLVVREEKVLEPQKEIPPVIEEEKPLEITKPSIINRFLNFGYHFPETPRVIDTIIIHSVYNILWEDPYDVEGVIQEYKMHKVAAHYLIDRQGMVYQTVPDLAIAYHAGLSQMPAPDKRTNINDFSIGIEVINTKTESPTEAQYQSLAQLVKYLQKEYNIPAKNILGHKDIAPGRKTDPWNFDWEYFQSLLK